MAAFWTFAELQKRDPSISRKEFNAAKKAWAVEMPKIEKHVRTHTKKLRALLKAGRYVVTLEKEWFSPDGASYGWVFEVVSDHSSARAANAERVKATRESMPKGAGLSPYGRYAVHPRPKGEFPTGTARSYSAWRDQLHPVDIEIWEAARAVTELMDRAAADLLTPTEGSPTPSQRIENWTALLERISAVNFPTATWLKVAAALDRAMESRIAAEVDNPDRPDDKDRLRHWDGWIRRQLKAAIR